MKDWFINIFGGGIFDGVYEMLNVALLGDGDYALASKFTSAIYNNVMVPIALSLVVIYLVCNLIERSTNEQFTYEQMFLMLAKAIVAVFIISKGFDLMLEFQNAGLSFLKDLSSTATSLGLGTNTGGGEAYIKSNPELMQLYKNYTGETFPKEPSFFKNIGLVIGNGFTLLLSNLAVLIIKACVYVIVFMRILEIYVRTMFAPIALSDIFGHGLNSTGFRFMKSYLAVSIQVAAIYGCILLNTVISSSLAKGGMGDITFIFKYLGLAAATIGLMFKSQSLIKEFVGTN